MAGKLINMNEAAKSLSTTIGRNKLFQILRERNILDKNNVVYQKYVDRGYFELIRETYYRNGIKNSYFKTVVTDSGMDFLRRILEEYEPKSEIQELFV